MNYYIREISALAGVSTRTLRYYDEIGLLHPDHIDTSGYRIYTSKQVDLLQEILLWRQLEIPLKEIKNYLSTNKESKLTLLLQHQKYVEKKIEKEQKLLQTIEQTILYHKGVTTMNDEQKFEGLKDQLIQDNEDKYGNEIRQKYGDQIVDSSYQQMKKLSKWEFNEANRIGKEILDLLRQELPNKDPNSNAMQNVCKLHQQWIQFYWPTYSEDAHMSLVTMYTQDDRFKSYYDAAGNGATMLLHDAMKIYLKKDN